MEHNQPKNFIAKPFAFHEEVELLIVDVNNLGYGIGKVNNWVITVPFVNIGEKVIARIFRNHKNYSEADLVSVLIPSEKRVQPTCPLFGECGGCQYQHISYEEQLNLKQEQIVQLFKRLAKLEVDVAYPIHSEHTYGYRTKLTPHFEKPKDNKNLKIGFLANGCKRRLIDVPACPIASDKINRELPIVRDNVINHSSKYKNGATILLRDTINGIETDNNKVVQHEVCGKIFNFEAGNFFQNNPYVLPKMIDYVIQQAIGTKFLVDAYCGVGLFGIISSQYFESATGIELSEGAIKLAKFNAKQNNIFNINFIGGSAERIFENISYFNNDTTILIDPPRSGCSVDFLQQLKQFSPAKIVYVSCAPDTQARDVQILSDMYNVTACQPIDLFPQTRHIENVITLTK